MICLRSKTSRLKFEVKAFIANIKDPAENKG